MTLDPIEDVIEAYRQGEIIIIADDEYRENEGDLVVAAEKVTADHINFMARHGCGLICVAMTRERLQKLGLNRMPVRGKGDVYRTAFMASVDASENITTGISASDRAKTIEVLVSDEFGPEDLMSPGHMFPLEAVSGGVLERPGHTEAAVDHGIKMTSVASLIRYRHSQEPLVEFEREVRFPSKHGEFRLLLYRSLLRDEHHVALVKGEPDSSSSVLVRVHSECLTGDVLGSLRCDCGSQISKALERIEEEGTGVVLYMRQEGRGIGLANKIHAYELQDRGLDTVEANEHLGFEADARDYGAGAQILQHIGIKQVRLMTNNPRKVDGLEQCGIEVTERLPLVCDTSPHSERYLNTKKEKLGHIL
jgi:3,4-dihydroxy 2-butanone 4-phosphate synthase/GTP cyclohydrolase II